MRLRVQADPPSIDLAGFQRLGAVERDIARSPAAVASTVAAVAGLLVAGLGGAFVFGLVAVPGWDGDKAGSVVSAGGLLWAAVAAGLGHACLHRRLACLRCPHCGGPLARHVADLGAAEQGRWGQKGVYLDGRRYSAPFLGEGDRRPWVRVMKEVRACAACRAYVDGAMRHERACSDDELERLRQHRTAGPPAGAGPDREIGTNR